MREKSERERVRVERESEGDRAEVRRVERDAAIIKEQHALPREGMWI